MNSVGCEAVERARLHGNAFCVTVGLLREVERLQHPESCKAPTSHQSWGIHSTLHLLSRHSPGDVNPFRKISGHAVEQAETLLTQTAADGSSLDSRKFSRLTRGRRLANKIDQIFFDGVKSVEVVHDKDVPLAGFGGDFL